MGRDLLLLGLVSLSAVTADDTCISPGTCTAPIATYSNVPRGPVPSQQWNINGGFCGAFSIQQSTLAFGGWISQDLIRKANKDQPGPKFMHGDDELGYEVVPSNVAYTAQHLRLAYDEWDYNSTSPQTNAYTSWLKSHLVLGQPVVWFPMCKGDSTRCYPFSCPNGGSMDHVEPIYGIFSNHSLDDLTVYDDDVILHMSDQDLMPYYRQMSTLQDSTAMDGNCADAQPGFGYNEMYPCFDEEVTYGLSVMGLDVVGDVDTTLLQVSLTVGITYEPNVRDGEDAIPIYGEVMVKGFTEDQIALGCSITLYRYNNVTNLPHQPPFDNTNYEYSYSLTLGSEEQSVKFADPNTFMSDTEVFYIAATDANV